MDNQNRCTAGRTPGAKPDPWGPSGSAGFTILELMVTIVLAGILAAIAIPNMSTFMKDNARANNINALVGVLTYARSEAVSRKTRVVACRVQNLTTCQTNLNVASCSCQGAKGDFTDGLVVFTDVDGNSQPDGTDVILRIFDPRASGGVTLNSNVAQVSYASNGLFDEDADMIFAYCDDREEAHGRQIDIGLAGPPRIQYLSDGGNTCDP